MNELYHHGVKGMRWGVRKARTMSADASEARAIKKKKVSEMSNAELRKLNDRQTLERTHKQLNPGVVKRGVAVVAATAVATSSIITLSKNSKQLVSMGKTAVKNIQNLPAYAQRIKDLLDFK